MPQEDKLKEFAREAALLHEKWRTEVSSTSAQLDKIYQPYKEKVENWWSKEHEEYMSPQDIAACKEISMKNEEFHTLVRNLLISALVEVHGDVKAVWVKQPPVGVEGSLSRTQSRDYRLALDETYSLEVSWYDYGADVYAPRESYRECYSFSIRSIRGMLRGTRRHDFPLIALEVCQLPERREFHLKTGIDELLLKLGTRLRETFG